MHPNINFKNHFGNSIYLIAIKNNRQDLIFNYIYNWFKGN